jgi:hypothetical protein
VILYPFITTALCLCGVILYPFITTALCLRGVILYPFITPLLNSIEVTITLDTLA